MKAYVKEIERKKVVCCLENQKEFKELLIHEDSDFKSITLGENDVEIEDEKILFKMVEKNGNNK